jgi:NAD(P)-dependent dehydrogenase (short-subunit alcohol dehydrogenase family)
MGAAEAALFVEEGARVVITDVLEEDGKLKAKEISPDGSSCVFVKHDVTNPDNWSTVVESAVAQFGQIDILVNNAGIFEAGGITTTTLDMWNRTIGINQTGVFLGMKAVAEHMMKRRSGAIVNISSIAGMQGSAGFIAYGASKWAVRGMTKSAARELAPFGVRVNSIHPGIIDTAMLQTFEQAGAGVREAVRQRIPAGREAEPIEIARLALFLASDESSYSTGAEFIADGGWMS